MISQICIFIFGALGLLLVNDPRPHVRRFGCISGLIGQPFWYIAAFHAGQWGIFASSFLYSASWIRGFYYAWVVPYRAKTSR